MDIRVVGERICNHFVSFDEELPAERREQLNGYLNLLTQHVSLTNGNPETRSSMLQRSGIILYIELIFERPGFLTRKFDCNTDASVWTESE